MSDVSLETNYCEVDSKSQNHSLQTLTCKINPSLKK